LLYRINISFFASIVRKMGSFRTAIYSSTNVLPSVCLFLVVLVQAEAVSELLQARTTGAADSALAGLAGGVGKAVRELRAQVCVFTLGSTHVLKRLPLSNCLSYQSGT